MDGSEKIQNVVRATAVATLSAWLGVLPSAWGFGTSSPTSQDKPQAQSSVAPAASPVSAQSVSFQDKLAAEEKAHVDRVAGWCKELREEVAKLKWNVDPCPEGVQWQIGGNSGSGRPLIYAEFGDRTAENTTLVFSMVHPDEITPLYLGLQLIHWMKEHQRKLPATRVVIAPLVNPDGLYRNPKTRVNGRGVDLNRNFSTSDWKSHALRAWKLKYQSNPRRYPGPTAASEPETVFQQELIKRVRPQKILSVHAPLNHMDYDGPNALALARFPKEYVQECLTLRKRLKAISSGFFPGSLGNYAGQEMGIPTLTLELPTADASKADDYWNKFSTGISAMIEFKVPEVAKYQEQAALSDKRAVPH